MGQEGEKEREPNIDVRETLIGLPLACRTHPDQGLNLQPRHVP